jgi:hypothetical protein
MKTSEINQSARELLLRQVRRLIVLFIVGLVISGVTAFPIAWELTLAHEWVEKFSLDNALAQWVERVYQAVFETYSRHPFMAYGTDWLAFAHLVIAVAFIGPLRDPVRNIWIIQFGLISCVAIFPLALIAGSIRDIPVYWQLIDCSFGVFGGGLLWICYRKILSLEKMPL